MSTYDFGIYFGGYSMVIAYSKDDRVDVIVNEAGDRTTPAALAILNNDYSVGLPVKQNLIRNATNTILYAKHFIGGQIDERLARKTPCQRDVGKDGLVVFKVEKNDKEVEMSLKQAIEHQLRYLLDLAKSSLGLKDTLNCVLSVPCYFTIEQKKFLQDCASSVGFHVHSTVKNPLGACLAYNLDEDNLKVNKLLVYQMGSSSLELTLIQQTNGLFRIVDSIHSLEIGGDLFTDLIVTILIEEFKRKNRNMDPSDNKRSMSKLKSDAEYLKNILSTMERAHCSIDALYEGIDFDYYLTRQRFEGACSKLYSSCLKPIDDLLSKNNLKEIDIDKVIVCGASTKMCKLQTLLKDKFPSTTQLLNQLSTDEVIALGCARQSAIMSASKLKKFDPSDAQFQCLAKRVYMKVGSEESENEIGVFEAYTPIPIKRLVTVSINGPQQVFVYEDDNKLLTRIDLKEFSSKEVNCLFQIKLDGTFEITATESSSNQTVTIYLNSES